MWKIGEIVAVIFLVGSVQHDRFVEGYMVGSNPYHRRENLDPRGRYVLEWKVDWPASRVTFNVTVRTRGYVGFGLSPDGRMSGADIVIGGVTPSGKAYFSDRHAVANQVPEEDPSQDWRLHEARESRTETFLSFSRAFDTGDPQDYPITEDRIALIWAFGEKDNSGEYHFRNRGVFDVHLLSRDYTPPITRDAQTGAPLSVESMKDVKVWTIPTEIVLPSAPTTYWCTMHQTPAEIQRKHHIIGMEFRFPSEDVRPFVHHLQVYKCHVPRGQNRSPQAMFGSYLQHRGQSCVSVPVATGPMPVEYCTQLVDGWAIGGRAIFYPPHVGLPIEPNEYYVTQVHYDNPKQVSGKKVSAYLDYFYTSTLRQFESGMLTVGSELPAVPPSVLIPPFSPAHSIHGACSSECTQAMFPPEGVTIFMMNLHSHNVGVRMKLQHFRGGRELPQILADENYSNQFQQVRAIHREVRILPGDQLVTTCVYDNTKTNGTTVGGYSTSQEMCLAIMGVYNRIPDFYRCTSGPDSVAHRQRFLAGVTNVTWQESQLEYVVDPPHPLAGLTITQVSDGYVNWNLKLREELQQFHKTFPQKAYCTPELYAREPGSTPTNPEQLVSCSSCHNFTRK